ncbi:flagellar biosynthetic protein FliR [Histidinibacterium lentulum]|uniref:Type III secretion protein n=1 Tax=Histidinibacterium lentulum TaxID=2480588 RepID=A0A3N2R785_9RHOB|nr:flagellar biosynthetic protein FliR [Histidinibacterium lentulum]ROU03241.1 type III secretion protein [Histidinibacterium lentulum]
MISTLSELLPVAGDAFSTAIWVFLRVGGMIAALPAFGEQSVPLRVRLAMAFAFTLLVAPAVPAGASFVAPPGPAAVLSETLVGLAFGLFIRFFVFALQIAGTIAAQSTSLSQILGAQAGIDPLPAMGHVLVIGGIALATILGLHVAAAEYIIRSYDLVPVGTLPDPARLADVGVAETARSFSLAFVLSAPFLVASLLYNLTLGVINRAMPQLMVSFVGAPAITAGGLALLALAAAPLLQLWSGALFTFLESPFGPLP